MKILLLLMGQVWLICRVRGGSGQGLQSRESWAGRADRRKILLLVMVWYTQLTMNAFKTGLWSVLSNLPVVLELLLSLFKNPIGLRTLPNCR
jgi:hypothetical protein